MIGNSLLCHSASVTVPFILFVKGVCMLPSFSQAYLYHWSLSCLPLAILTIVFAWSSHCALSEVMFWLWLQLAVYLLHQAEEHFWPGGFKQFVNKKIFHSSIPNSPLSEVDVFWINIPFIWILFPLALVMAQHVDIAVGLFLPVFGMVNAITHVFAWFIKRCYNPGLVVSLCLNIPTGYYTIKMMLDAGCITPKIIVVMTAVAVAMHVGMVSFAIMRYRMAQKISK